MAKSGEGPEERRLAYVAITRARKTCTITFARSRFRNGVTNPTRESQFLKDIDPRFLLMEQKTLTTSREGSADGFWESMRQRRESNMPERATPAPPQPVKRVPLQAAVSSSAKISEAAEQLMVGNVIEHERFGRGVVTSIELLGGDKRAFVTFDSAGQKQLLLKFAKFRIVE